MTNITEDANALPVRLNCPLKVGLGQAPVADMRCGDNFAAPDTGNAAAKRLSGPRSP